MPFAAEALIGGGANTTHKWGPLGANQKSETSAATHVFQTSELPTD